jgi:hypothetical protein
MVNRGLYDYLLGWVANERSGGIVSGVNDRLLVVCGLWHHAGPA